MRSHPVSAERDFWFSHTDSCIPATGCAPPPPQAPGPAPAHSHAAEKQPYAASAAHFTCTFPLWPVGTGPMCHAAGCGEAGLRPLLRWPHSGLGFWAWKERARTWRAEGAWGSLPTGQGGPEVRLLSTCPRASSLLSVPTCFSCHRHFDWRLRTPDARSSDCRPPCTPLRRCAIGAESGARALGEVGGEGGEGRERPPSCSCHWVIMSNGLSRSLEQLQGDSLTLFPASDAAENGAN